MRRRDTALEREQQLTAFFAERLRALEAPAHDAAQPAQQDIPRRARRTPESPGPSATPPAESGAAEQPAQGAVRVGYPPGGGEPQSMAEPLPWWRRMFGR
jgi:hypothetical protein